jgi:hypothetical protein
MRLSALCPPFFYRMIPKSAVAVFGKDHAQKTGAMDGLSDSVQQNSDAKPHRENEIACVRPRERGG